MIQNLDSFDRQAIISEPEAEYCPECGSILNVTTDILEFWGVKATHTEKECVECLYYEGP